MGLDCVSLHQMPHRFVTLYKSQPLPWILLFTHTFGPKPEGGGRGLGQNECSDCHLGNFKNDLDNDCSSYIYCNFFFFFFLQLTDINEYVLMNKNIPILLRLARYPPFV